MPKLIYALDYSRMFIRVYTPLWVLRRGIALALYSFHQRKVRQRENKQDVAFVLSAGYIIASRLK